MNTQQQPKYKKADVLQAWRVMPENQPILPHMVPVAYKARGSRYGACGIRIDGNPQFVEAVMSCLKNVIDGENHVTRLELARHAVDGSGLDKCFENADAKAEVVYIRLHMRGSEGAIASAIFDKDLDGATQKFQDAWKLA